MGNVLWKFTAQTLKVEIEPSSLDAVLTDPPYFGNVQYAELMDFCYVWLRKLRAKTNLFQSPSTRNSKELTGNENMSRGLDWILPEGYHPCSSGCKGLEEGCTPRLYLSPQ